MKLKFNILVLFLLSLTNFVFAQTERKITRKGNSQYDTGNFVDAEINYKKAIDKNADLLEAQFNLGDALVKQERYDEALESFEVVSASTENQELKAEALHNKGNVLLAQQDLEGAVEAYKESLRANPKDSETRYNYAYAKKQLEQQQQQQEQEQQNEENKDENKEEEDQQEQDQNEDKGDNQNEDSENKEEQSDENSEDKNDEPQDQSENQEDEQKQDQQDKGQTDGEDADEEREGEKPQPRENKLSSEEAQRLLEALNQEENKVQDKLKKHKIKGAKIKIEKDW